MIPLVVGVTGHRNLDPESVVVLAGRIRHEFRELRRKMPHTPIIVVSALAEGADRIAAQVALDCGFELWCVLPTAVEEYSKDFVTELSRSELQRLLAAASKVINASLASGHAKDSSSRPQIYVDAGEEICRLSHVLLAVWDGVTSDKPGGTGQVVRAFRTGSFSGAVRSGIAFPDCGMVIHVQLPKGRNDAASKGMHHLPPNPGLTGKALLPGGETEMRRLFALGLKNLEAFNHACSRCAGEPEAAALQLLPANYPWREDRALARWLRVFSQADVLSYAAMRRRQSSMLTVVVLFVTFSMASLLYGGLILQVWPLILGLASLSAAVPVYFWHRRKGDDEAWVGCRALAEFLRVAIVWRASGLQDSIHYVLAEENILPADWLGMSARWMDNDNRHIDNSENIPAESRNAVGGFWAKGQQDYFADEGNKIGHHAKRAKRYSLISGICIALALVTYIFTIGIDIGGVGLKGSNEAAALTVWTMYGYWALLSLAAVVAAYNQIMAHAEHEAEYAYALVKFRFAGIRLAGAAEQKGPEILLSLGRAALRETAGWLRLHRARPLRLPF